MLGHELLARVERDGHGFERGELVAATVRRSCGHCDACAAGAPDACMTGDYLERGITRLHGFGSELVAESPEHLVRIPAELGTLARARRARLDLRARDPPRARHRRPPAVEAGARARARHGRDRDARHLPAAARRLRGLDRRALGARRRQGAAGGGLRRALRRDRRHASGGCRRRTSAASTSCSRRPATRRSWRDALGLLARNGVACLLGLDGRPREVTLDGRVIGVDAILQNRALFGSVNANRVDWLAAVGQLDARAAALARRAGGVRRARGAGRPLRRGVRASAASRRPSPSRNEGRAAHRAGGLPRRGPGVVRALGRPALGRHARRRRARARRGRRGRSAATSATSPRRCARARGGGARHRRRARVRARGARRRRSPASRTLWRRPGRADERGRLRSRRAASTAARWPTTSAPGAGSALPARRRRLGRRRARGVTISNGLDWSPDGSRAYYNDTAPAPCRRLRLRPRRRA